MLQDSTNSFHGTGNCNTAPLPKAPSFAPHAYASQTSSPYACLNLPEDPFAPTPFKGSQSGPSAQPWRTYPGLPGHPPIPVPPLKAPPPSKRSLPFNEVPAAMAEAPFRRLLPFNEAPFAMPLPPEAPPPCKTPVPLPFHAIPISNPPAYDLPHICRDSPMITTPHGIILNPAFKADRHTLSAGRQPNTNLQTALTHAPMSRPAQVQPHASFPHHHSQAPFLSGLPPHAYLPYSTCGTTQSEPHMVQVPAPHAMTGLTGSYERFDPTARLPPFIAPHSRSLDKPSVQADGLKTSAMHKPSAAASLAAAREEKEQTAVLQAKRLSFWCHVKHSRGETPELSRDQVKALVQVPVCCILCMVAAKRK